MAAAPDASRRLAEWLVFLAPLPVFVILVYVVPMAGVLGWSFTKPELGLQNYETVLTESAILSIFIRTFRICLIVTAISLFVGYILAYNWVLGGPIRRKVVEIGVLVPFWISVLVRALGWIAVLQNRGLINTWLADLDLIATPLPLVRNELGVVIGMVHFMVPFCVFPIAAGMRNIDVRLLKASRGLGAGGLRTFWQVFFPLSLPGTIGAAVITFVFTLGFFITPALLGGGRVVMVAEYVYVQMFQAANWGVGAAFSVTLLILVAALMCAMTRIVRVQDLVR